MARASSASWSSPSATRTRGRCCDDGRTSAHGIYPPPAIWALVVHATHESPNPRTLYARLPPSGLWMCARQSAQGFAHIIFPIPAKWDEDVRAPHGLPKPRTLFARLPPFALWLCAHRLADATRAHYFPVSRHLGPGCARVGWPMLLAHVISPFPAIWALSVRGVGGRCCASIG
jgi:hypothetical protein